MRGLWKRFIRDRRGAVAIFVAAGIAMFVGFLGLSTDAARGYMVKGKLSEALDAAALAGGRVMNSPNRNADIAMFFNANFPPGYLGATLTGPTIAVGADGKTVTLTASASLPTTLMRVIGFETMTVAASTEVTIESKNLEVALVLDVTGSMGNPISKINDLKVAAGDLVDLVVQDVQTPFYSKVAIVPYSMGVNVGAAYALGVRGAVNSTTHAITGAAKTDPLKITSANHGYNNNDKIFITGVNGMTQLNNKSYLVANKTTNDFTLKTLAGTNINGTSGYSTYTSGGLIYCAWEGCQYYGFRPASGSIERTHQISTCVSERTGANAFTDVAPSTTLLGRNYPATSTSYPAAHSNNPCLTPTIVPLTSDKASLHTAINALAAGGSTGGHIGVGWGWYLVSPNFGYLFPAISQPAAYSAPDLKKVVIIMTDGEYNSVYCTGVIAANSTTDGSSGDVRDHINCNAPNGNAYTQSETLCTNMKAAGVIVYTVGFQVLSTPAAQSLVNNCATGPTYVYLPADGTQLKDAFRDIAGRISQLRLSK